MVRRLEESAETWKRRHRWQRFVAIHAGFLDLFAAPRRIERLATGFQFTEGPVWLPETERLLFSDIPANRIYQLAPASRVVTIFREPSNHSNGLTRDPKGRLIACEHGKRRVTRTELDGTITVLTDRFAGNLLNSPNDVVVARDGAIYFTDPPYGIRPQQQQQPTQGVYRIAPDGSIRQVVDDFDRPNGLIFSPDGRYLYIDDSSARCHIRRFKVQADGSLTDGQVFYDMTSRASGDPDGMAIDEHGYLYCTGPGGIWVFAPTGRHLGTVFLSEQPANCTWGDHDGRSLYITARTSIYRIRCADTGHRGFPQSI
ncbi:SMP-30/gluconolactonase/LRE family protein [Halomicronema sp. CCY15110]|uniref:SMP-30/gluconolactonase/LRE family protein n=1 Tax=Halomicronema sp. CCY15110 TaxID=2767773 RepID=UPI00194EEDE0|nr:SMP-30/gluconolactonase/LRE family protein [Halomicronema sp. CCY15110]